MGGLGVLYDWITYWGVCETRSLVAAAFRLPHDGLAGGGGSMGNGQLKPCGFSKHYGVTEDFVCLMLIFAILCFPGWIFLIRLFYRTSTDHSGRVVTYTSDSNPSDCTNITCNYTALYVIKPPDSGGFVK